MNDNYCIFRTAKLKTLQDVTLVLKEQQRDENYDSVRADKSLSYRNSYSDDFENSIQKFENLLPKKIRKNAVLGLNFVVTTSEEFSSLEEENLFYEKARNFIAEKFGKTVAWAIHRDESSTHMQVVTMPLVEGKLNARALIGGDKHRMEHLQDEFYQEVGKPFGLVRGKSVQETHAKHKEVEQLHREEKENLERLQEQLFNQIEELKRLEMEYKTALKSLQDVLKREEFEKEEEKRYQRVKDAIKNISKANLIPKEEPKREEKSQNRIDQIKPKRHSWDFEL